MKAYDIYIKWQPGPPQGWKEREQRISERLMAHANDTPTLPRIVGDGLLLFVVPNVT